MKSFGFKVGQTQFRKRPGWRLAAAGRNLRELLGNIRTGLV